jgi:hypothetical protein
MRRVRQGRVVLGAVVAAVCSIALTASPASAGLSGPCTATIGGKNVADLETGPTSTPVKVKENDRVIVTMSSSRQMNHLEITLNFAGSGVTVKDKDISSNSWAESVPVDDYAKWGVGLYLIEGVGTGTGFSCTGDALVEVEGSPFGTFAGWIALGVAILGVLGVVVMTLGALRGTLGRLAAVLIGGIAGLLAGAGVGVLLQQFAVVYPTRNVAWAELGIGILVGIVAPLLAGLAGGTGSAAPMPQGPAPADPAA